MPVHRQARRKMYLRSHRPVNLRGRRWEEVTEKSLDKHFHENNEQAYRVRLLSLLAGLLRAQFREFGLEDHELHGADQKLAFE